MESVSERLQSGGVSRQFQYPHDPHDPEDLDDAPDVLELFCAVACTVETKRQVEWEDGKHVDEVQRTLQQTRHFICQQEVKVS